MIREVVAKHLGIDVTVIATPPPNGEVITTDAQPTTQENTSPQPPTGQCKGLHGSKVDASMEYVVP